MTISMNFSDNVTVKNANGTAVAVEYLSGSLNENKTFSINASIQNYDEFVNNKEDAVKKIHDFVDEVINKVVANCGNVVTASTGTTDTTTVESGETK